MIVNYSDKGRIFRNSMTEKGNGIYLGYYNDKLGIKIGETGNDFTARWSLLSRDSRTGFRAVFCYEVGDYGESTEIVRKVLEALIRNKVSIYAANHAKIFSFQGDSFLCSPEACDKLIEYVREQNYNWEKYFKRMEEKTFNTVCKMRELGFSFPSRRETMGYILCQVHECETERGN